MSTITYKEYLDRIHGGWFGKCLGGAAGAPFEGFKKIIEVRDFLDVLDPNIPNDDLDIQLLWLDVLQSEGIHISSKDLADAWDEKCHYPMMEYGLFLKNYERGIYPPFSGNFNNPIFKGGNGCPIRSEIWGFIFPGNPTLAAKYAQMDGSLDHSGDSVWIEQFFSAMESMAFFISNINDLIKTCMIYLPKDSKAHRCVVSMIKCHEQYPDDWEKARTRALRLFGHHDFTSSVTNLAFVLIGLLYGNGDLRNTINYALKCGYDTDCTCATAAAILGTLKGYSNIEEEFKNLIDDRFVVGINVKRSNNSIRMLSEETCCIGIEALAELNSGCCITEVPSSLKVLSRPMIKKPVTISIEYMHYPAIGYEDKSGFQIVLNNSTKKRINGSLSIQGVPEGFKLQCGMFEVSLLPEQTETLDCVLYSSEKLEKINNTNIMTAEFSDSENQIKETMKFGYAGASIWKVSGPYFEEFNYMNNPKFPSPHPEGCLLPSLESMVNNAAYLNKEYISEGTPSRSIFDEEYEIINSYEDMLQIDDVFSYLGQACFYAMQELYSPKDRDVWLVIGNNDGYRLWVNDELIHERDENRLWTPYNNSEVVKLKKGLNTITIKLLRRTENIKFSIAIRKYNNLHWHCNRWYVDFSSKV